MAVFDQNTGAVILYQSFFAQNSLTQIGVLVHVYTHTIQGGEAAIPPANSPLWRNYALAIVYWGRGDRAHADAALQALIRDSGDSAATQIADAYAQRDDEAAMFHWLDVAKQTGDPGIVEIRYLPYVSRYSSDARFVALVNELGLVPDSTERKAQAGNAP